MRKRPAITIIAAVAQNGVIGRKGDLPWPRMPADLGHFRDLSVRKPVIMGSKTFASLAKPLPKRINIILSRDENLCLPGCKVAHSVDEALAMVEDQKEVVIAGGASVYKQFLPLADKMELTIVHADFEGDAFFPEYDPTDWQETKRTDYPADQENPYPYSFITLEKKK